MRDVQEQIALPEGGHETEIASAGAGYALLAYGTWGLLPIFWKLFQVRQIPALEVLAHRMVWSIPVVLGLLFLQRRLPELRAEFKQVKRLPLLFVTALMLGCNWGLYIYGVTSNHIVETSLGYFINPLLNVVLGAVFLRERLNPWQIIAVLLAAAGVGNLIWNLGEWPWLALTLAVTFSIYGLLRKVAPAAPLIGLSVETILLAPLALAFLIYQAVGSGGHFGSGTALDLLFMTTGLATSLPLLWFALAGKRLRFATLGLFQYIAPSLQFILGVFFYGEHFTDVHTISFICIWSGLAIYSGNMLWERNVETRMQAEELASRSI